MQYGTPVAIGWRAQVIRFMDGTDQRFLSRGRPLRRWSIDLRLLTESEIATLEAFFSTTGGEYSTFEFPDPVSGHTVPNCRLATPELVSHYQDVDIAATSLWVVETNA
jgi:hypothetical protein